MPSCGKAALWELPDDQDFSFPFNLPGVRDSGMTETIYGFDGFTFRGAMKDCWLHYHRAMRLNASKLPHRRRSS